MNSTSITARSWKDSAIRTLKSNKFHRWLLCSFAGMSALYQVFNANWMFVWAVVASVVILIIGAIATDEDYYRQSDQKVLLWRNIKMAIGVTLLASNFLYTSAYQVAIVGNGGAVRYWPGGLAITRFTPFIDEGYYYPDVFIERARCKGDGMSFEVAAQLVIPFDTLPVAHVHTGSWNKIIAMTRVELCKTIDGKALAQAYAAGTPPSTFTVEQKVLDERSHLNDYGVFFNGVVEVSNIHAYLVQNPN